MKVAEIINVLSSCSNTVFPLSKAKYVIGKYYAFEKKNYYRSGNKGLDFIVFHVIHSVLRRVNLGIHSILHHEIYYNVKVLHMFFICPTSRPQNRQAKLI